MEFFEEDEAHKQWLDEIEKQEIVRSCGGCVYNLKKDLYNLESPTYCYNSACSHVGTRWTLCTDARDADYGLCGIEAIHFKISHV